MPPKQHNKSMNGRGKTIFFLLPQEGSTSNQASSQIGNKQTHAKTQRSHRTTVQTESRRILLKSFQANGSVPETQVAACRFTCESHELIVLGALSITLA